MILPQKCPTCNSNLEWDENKINLKCFNINCPAQMMNKLILFAKKIELQLLSEKSIESLFNNNLIKNYYDFFNLKKSDLLKLDRVGEKLADNWLTAIEQVKSSLTPAKLLAALNINNWGKRKFETVFKKIDFQNLINLSNETPEKFCTVLCNIEGVQEKSAMHLFEGLNFYKEQIELLKNFLTIEVQKEETHSLLNGASFCVTGTLSMPRKLIVEKIESNGGVYKDSIVKGLNYLICNEESNSSKTQKAKALNVNIINEEKFLLMIGE